jgi:hemerythrin-like domain-containing protein
MDALRREFLATAGLGAAGLALGAAQPQADREPVSPIEDLMREHAVLDRILLVYETGLRRLREHRPDKLIVPEWFRTAAVMVRRVIEDYHEKLEEDYVFPVFQQHRRLVDLTAILRQQHQAGRTLTDTILANAADDRFADPNARDELLRACEAYARIFRPHMARESTVLFPALHGLLDERAMSLLGERFETAERQRFGRRGFERIVDEVASLEKQMGIYELAWTLPPLAAGPRYLRR